jgi:hypothetical protein
MRNSIRIGTAVLLFMFSACNQPSKENKKANQSFDNEVEPKEVEREDSYIGESGDCDFEDGTYSANVDYYNEETDFENTYTLDVEVEDCEVIQINFPNGGWLDSDHITPAELDSDGRCTIYGEEGKVYEVEVLE